MDTNNESFNSLKKHFEQLQELHDNQKKIIARLQQENYQLKEQLEELLRENKNLPKST